MSDPMAERTTMAAALLHVVLRGGGKPAEGKQTGDESEELVRVHRDDSTARVRRTREQRRARAARCKTERDIDDGEDVKQDTHGGEG